MPVSASNPSPRQAASAALRRLGIFLVVGAGLSAVALLSGHGLPCPFRMATGVRCPLCGATTMGTALLRGDVAAAWQANGFVLIVLAQLLVAGGVWVAELVSGRRWWPTGWPGRLDRWLVVWAVAGVGFDIVRVAL